MYVMDEAFDGWYTPKTYHDYSRIFAENWQDDLTAMIAKDYSHPSVILYSIGNEVSETACEQGVQTAEQMTALAHALDNTRPVTAGINVLLNVYNQKGIGVYKETESYKPEPLPPKKQEEKKKESGSAFFNMVMQHLGPLMFYMSKGKKGDAACRAVAEKLDILGLNYAASRYEEDCLTYPNRIMVGSETIIGELPYNWEQVKKHPAVIGDFAWAAIDYLGEAGIGQMIPQDTPGLPIAAGSGAIDLTGNITAEAYFQQTVWGLRKAPYLGVRPLIWSHKKMTGSAWRMTNAVESWTWPGCEGQKATVEVYSDAPLVALYCNNRLIGKKKPKKYCAIFKAAYCPGTLRAVALDADGNAIGQAELKTAGEETKILLSSEKTVIHADGQELCFIPHNPDGCQRHMETRQGSPAFDSYGWPRPATSAGKCRHPNHGNLHRQYPQHVARPCPCRSPRRNKAGHSTHHHHRRRLRTAKRGDTDCINRQFLCRRWVPHLH